MELPTQFTAEEVEARFDEVLERLSKRSLPEASVELLSVTGGSVESNARGAAVIRPTSARAIGLPFFARTATLSYDTLPEGEVVTETSPARLIKVGDRWRREGLEGPWKTRHVFELRERERTLTYHVPRGDQLATLPPRPNAGRAQPRARYEIPPAATKIRGHGTVKLRTGQSYEVHGERILERPLADGELGIRPGGVYGVFESDVPTFESKPKALIGTKWTPLLPIDETE